MHPGTATSLTQHLRTLRRRWKLLLVTTAVGVVATLLIAFLLPPTYRSTATILIEQQEIPQDLVRSTITTFADQRIQVISQRVMTTTNLLEIIRRNQLYPRDQQKQPREKLLARMRDDIRMDMISADVIDPRSGRPTQANIAFSVSYESRSPALAVQVANELTTLYLNENLASRTRLAGDTASFLAAQATRLNGDIVVLEQKLAEFKQRHADSLPEHNQLNLQMLDRAELELRDVDARIRSLEEQKVYLGAQLAQLSPSSQILTETGERILGPADRLKAVRSQLASAAAVYAPTHPDVMRLKREIEGLEREVNQGPEANDLERQLLEARGQLAGARERYSPDHPDVRALERRIEGLEQALATPASDASTPVPASKPDNPAYIQIRAQLEGADSELRALQLKRADIRGNIAEFERNLGLSPGIEREYRALARDYENAQAKYREVRAKEMEARLSQNMESDRKGERFTLIEPPLPPESPVSPNRGLILVLGILLSLGAGLGLAALRESVDGTIRGRSDIAALLDVPPLAVIPRIETALERGKKRMRFRYAAFGAIGTILIAAVLGHFLYRPLDLLWYAALRRLGI